MLTVHRHVDAPTDVVWRLLVDLREWPRWGPTVRRAELEHGGELGVGSRGRVWTPVGVPLPFVVTSFEPGRRWAWSVAGVPATDHGVSPEGSGTRLTMSAPVWAPAYLPVLAAALRRIEVLATA
ncbi:polyketide cyclase [Aeromicrobium sp. Root495]|uniref:SRPBCC family protein n=1 Tax=Aeromicrobium sp. Root495 TaxID=1736550 RepID=UPI0006F75480|nr:SRPBCC family protein [Aeromicrobium sp. Root495]KQY59821.1 polyketide cyclase [Aeromicrobium sp. Root495]